MATRSGSVDPGLLLWLMERTGMAEQELADAPEHESGLLGLAGTADMREVLVCAEAGDDDARPARDVYLHRLRAVIAAMAASLDGLDVLVFTGGVGERSAEIRRRAVAGLGFLGVEIDDQRNDNAGGDAESQRPRQGENARRARPRGSRDRPPGPSARGPKARRIRVKPHSGRPFAGMICGTPRMGERRLRNRVAVMKSGTHNPGAGTTAAHRPGLYRELRKRNERRARVAHLLAARREDGLRIERVVQAQRARRSRRGG